MVNDLHERTICVLDYNGERAFALFHFDKPAMVFYEQKAAAA